MSKICLIGENMTCTFFGHTRSPDDLKPKIKAAAIDLIENSGVKKFYVGTHGDFDRMATDVLMELRKQYEIEYFRVLSTVPTKKDEFDTADYSATVVPDGIERIMPKYRIIWRNKWMIKQSDYVITYINNPYGSGAAKYAALAQKRKKVMIKLGKY